MPRPSSFWVGYPNYSVKTTVYEAVVMFVVQPTDTCSLVGSSVLIYPALFVGLEISAAGPGVRML